MDIRAIQQSKIPPKSPPYSEESGLGQGGNRQKWVNTIVPAM